MNKVITTQAPMMGSLQCWCCGDDIRQLLLVPVSRPLCAECNAVHEEIVREAAA